MREFANLAHAFGFQLSETPSPKELQALFEEALETSYGHYLATSYIRRMRMAVYSPDNIGHYGLALTHYCHFTSPIRRYVDLVVHRIIFGDNPDRESLDTIARFCSEQERLSAKAEGSVNLLKKLRLLDKEHSKNPRKQYEAVVTRVKPFGFFFEVRDIMIEGFLHVSRIDDDYYFFDEGKEILVGNDFGETYHAGDKILVGLSLIDLIYLESKWYLVLKLIKTKKVKTRKKRRKK